MKIQTAMKKWKDTISIESLIVEEIVEMLDCMAEHIELLEKPISMNWSFKEGTDTYTEEFWYDLTDGGYLAPEKVLDDAEQIDKLREAIDLVLSFERAIDSRMEDPDDDSAGHDDPRYNP